MGSRRFQSHNLQGKILLWGSVLGVWIFFGGTEIVEASDMPTPRQVVEQWVRVYPGHLEKAARMTTRKFRSGVSQDEWVASNQPHLNNLGMKYIRAKIVHEEVRDAEAHVVVQAHIKTRMGDHPQDEWYMLVRGLKGEWLVNRIEVYTESFNTTP